MGAILLEDWSYRGLKALTMQNRYIRVDILLDQGAKIFNLIHLSSGKNMLWHNPRRPPAPAPFGANFDNWWSGGWDDLFPNGLECEVNGEVIPYLGELWTLPWDYEVIDRGLECIKIKLTCQSVILPAKVTKLITIEREKSGIHIDYEIENLGSLPFNYMFGVHPALAITPNHRIDLPARKVFVADSLNNRMGIVGNTYSWPFVTNMQGERIDLSRIGKPDDGIFGYFFATDFDDGWLAVTDTSEGIGFGMSFSTDIFPCFWLWLVYGGWRGHYVAAVEPFSSYPGALSEAIVQGRHRTLKAKEIERFEITCVIYEDMQSVIQIERDGLVIGVPKGKYSNKR
jgi:hypothetical protein